MKAVNPTLRAGIALNMTNFIVEDKSNEETVELASLMDSHINRWWLEASLHGRYPQNLVDFYGEKLERVVLPGDMPKLKVEPDFLGINYYRDQKINQPVMAVHSRSHSVQMEHRRCLTQTWAGR
jgi:beta-glucosidase